MNRHRILIVHPNLGPGGGSEAVGAWMIQALEDTADITLLTWTRPDFTAVNRWYGTSIRGAGVEVLTVPRTARRSLDAVPIRLALLQAALVTRAARKRAHAYDVVISAENETDLGRPIIQYIHYPRFLRPRPRADMRWYHHGPGLLKAYYAACDRIMGGPMPAIAQNMTLVNSAWTLERARVAYPSATMTVVYPPVADAGANVEWDRRERGFVCLGRLTSEKQADRVIQILAAVRRVVPDVHLHFAGGRTTRPEFRRLVRLIQPHRSWIEINDNLSRADLSALMARHRYGIHGTQEEHFGIGPAEMVRSGCIVFLPAGGGQVEIVGQDDRLLYRTPEDAVAKIVRVLTQPDEQSSLRAHLAECGRQYSAERFMQAIREAVVNFEGSSSTRRPRGSLP